MIFEIRGVGFSNKGAELMLLAIQQQISNWSAMNILALDLQTGGVSQRSKLGLHHLAKADYQRAPYLGKVISQAAGLIPTGLRRLFHIIIQSEVNVIMDASGFAYGDQWGTASCARLAKHVVHWKQQGKTIILMPQAFGPFAIPLNRDNMLRVLGHVDLIFARDRSSYECLIQLGGKSSHIRLYPDFTNTLPGQILDYMIPPFTRPCIVPNARMIDKTDANTGRIYLSFLEQCTEHLIRLGYQPIILIHESNDVLIARNLQKRFGEKVSLIQEDNPLILKGILGSSLIVIGSRYHALVGSLSQCVPTLGTSWSHKYQALFDDYEYSENLISLVDETNIATGEIDRLLDESTRKSHIEHLKIASQKQKDLTTKMWSEIQELLHM